MCGDSKVAQLARQLRLRIVADRTFQVVKGHTLHYWSTPDALLQAWDVHQGKPLAINYRGRRRFICRRNRRRLGAIETVLDARDERIGNGRSGNVCPPELIGAKEQRHDATGDEQFTENAGSTLQGCARRTHAHQRMCLIAATEPGGHRYRQFSGYSGTQTFETNHPS